MLYVVRLFRRLVPEQKGQGMVEYGLIIGMVAVLLIGTLIALTGDGGIGGAFNKVTNTLSSVLAGE